MRPDIKIILWGLGAMGSGIARLLLKKKGVRIVAAFDRDPTKAGKDLGELLGLENYGAKVGFPPTDGGNWPEQAKVMLLATSSFTQEVVGEINAGVGQGLNIITIAEEMSYPWAQAPELALEIDKRAKAQGVSVLGTGINPGFVLDTLILALTGPCQEVRRIKATRVNDLSPFGPTVMHTQGVGTTVAEFEQGLASGEIVGHVGFQESIHMIARALGWEIERIEEKRRPIVSKVRRETEHVKVEPGQVAGCHHTASGYVAGEARIELVHPQQILPQLEGVVTGDYIEIEGVPEIKLAIKPEIPGGLGTIAMAVNMIPQVIAARPGLLSMAEVAVPAAVLGDLKRISAWRTGEGLRMSD